ncbi:McrB family protein [Dictyobacter kobayashii]|uniref:Uncharacterized protein n=1 Tax=Dictyobacter kobayashii TaxID=2014872 RepID=A0A402AYL5_9CHLR|nr:AAA family ATPase [Dictyobacter kobayashii]GCE24165.1 hypothetical protein KDK_79650 [Dictyobacter kobayashii]
MPDSVQGAQASVKIWIEKTIVKGHPDRQYGEYAVGQVLFSPQRGKGGVDEYANMRAVRPGDIVLHLTDNNAFTGISQVRSSYQEVSGIANTEWGEQPSYLVRLQNFRYLDPPLTRGVFFFAPYRERLLVLLDTGERDLFYNSEPSLRQGAYLTPVPEPLFAILDEAYRENARVSLSSIINEFVQYFQHSGEVARQVDLDEELPDQAAVVLEELPSRLTAYEDGIIDLAPVKRPAYRDSLTDEVVSLAPVSTMPEFKLLQHIKRYIAARGYYFSDETIDNYHICLKTRPFVILAGLSGTGKSKLAQLYAEAIGHSVENDHYLRLPVRPNWNDDRYLIGYFDPITQRYITETALDFLLRAAEDRNHMYFMCLDEMNLAHVEYYFSQFLSALEEDEPAYRRINLYSKTIKNILDERQEASEEKRFVPPESVAIPTNLFFVGTINVDETTQPLSDKVMDRANTIDFFDVELNKIPKKQAGVNAVTITAADWHRYKSLETDDSYRALIDAIRKELNTVGLGIGYRIVKDIEQYLANSRNILEPEAAIDLQIKQRILPHIRGTRAIADVLDRLRNRLEREHLGRSVARLNEMKVRLERDGYVNFWR